MNITDFRVTPMRRVYEAVCDLAVRHGAAAAEGELIGLIPQDAYEPGAEWARAVPDFDPKLKILEHRLEQPIPWPEIRV